MSDVTRTEAEAKVEQFLKGMHDLQEAVSNKASIEQIEGLKAEFAELSKQKTELETQLKAKEKSDAEFQKNLKNLEDAIARGFATAGDGAEGAVKSDAEYKSFFFNEAMRRDGTVDGATYRKDVEKLVKGYYGISGSSAEKIIDEMIGNRKSYLVGQNDAAGMFAPVDMQTRIIEREFDTSPMRSLATVISTGAESVSFIIDDQDMVIQEIGETDTRSATAEPPFAEKVIHTHAIYARPKISEKMLEDSTINLEAFLSRKVGRDFGRKENTAFVLGDGIKSAKGILDYPDWSGGYQREAIGSRSTETADKVSAGDIVRLNYDLLSMYRQNGTFVCSDSTLAEIAVLKGDDGQYLLDRTLLADGVRETLLGRPVVTFADMPDPASAATFTTGDYVVCFADFEEAYVVVDRIGIIVIRDPYTQEGFVTYRFRKRYGGDVVNFQAIKRLKVS